MIINQCMVHVWIRCENIYSFYPYFPLNIVFFSSCGKIAYNGIFEATSFAWYVFCVCVYITIRDNTLINLITQYGSRNFQTRQSPTTFESSTLAQLSCQNDTLTFIKCNYKLRALIRTTYLLWEGKQLCLNFNEFHLMYNRFKYRNNLNSCNWKIKNCAADVMKGQFGNRFLNLVN